MIKKYFIILVVILGGIIGLAYLIDQPKVEPGISSKPISKSIGDGLAFLAQAHSPYHYKDAYLEYVYPSEELDCSLPGCNITYRILDAYFDVTMLKRQLNFTGQEVIREQILESEAVYQDIVPIWQEANIYNTLKSAEADQGGLAIDTYCILGYLQKDGAMAKRALDYLDESGEWLAEDAFPVDTWRNIADETWCMRLLAVTDTEPDNYGQMIQAKIEQTREFVDSDEPDSSKLGTLYHMLMFLSESDIQTSQAAVNELQQEIFKLEQTGAFNQDAVALANIIEALTVSNYYDEAYIANLADRLISLQLSDGSWRAGPQQLYPVFSSFRALIALATFR
ncbi:MAG: hypothetical protein V1853_04775 [bacterium]